MRHSTNILTRAACAFSLVAGLCLNLPVAAAGLDALSNSDTASGLKEALTRGAEAAVAQLGRKDGFLGDQRVKIPLPDTLQKAEKGLRMIGMGKQADELVETMNRAAETAVSEAKPVLVNAVKSMSISDARGILTGGDDSATQYFKRTTSDDLATRFLPIVKQATAKVGLASQYNQFAGAGAKFGLVSKDAADIDTYVTHKAMDGLFLMIAEQEKAIRKDPVGTGSAIISKVFGALK